MESLNSNPEEIQAAIMAFKTIGGRFEKRYRWNVEGRRNLVAFDHRSFTSSAETAECIVSGLEGPLLFFVMPASTEDKDLNSLPVVPFSFGLDLRNALVADAGLGDLARHATLTALGLHWTFVTGTGLCELADLQDLALLDLSMSLVTDKGLEGLASLHGLSALDLSETKITDAGLKHVGALHSLTWLSLSGSARNWGMFTDAGLRELATLKHLSELNLGLSYVTEAGVRRLQDALPHCSVSRCYMGSDWEGTHETGPAEPNL